MLSKKSTITSSTHEETYFSEWIDADKYEDFVALMKPTVDKFLGYEKEGYQVENSTTIHDSDCFGERDVIVVCIALEATKTNQ